MQYIAVLFCIISIYYLKSKYGQQRGTADNMAVAFGSDQFVFEENF